MIKLSTIIPIYNKEKALRETLQSIVDNHEINDNEYECILVDDESTDSCPKICKEFCEKYSYFKYIRIFNDGNNKPSNARNVGMRYSKGLYLHILDADDILCKTFYKDAVKILDITGVDVFIRGYFKSIKNGEKTVIQTMTPIFKDTAWGPPLCSSIFRNYIKTIKFEPILSQDVIFTWLALYNKRYYDDTSNVNSFVWRTEYSEVNKQKLDIQFPLNVVKALQKYEYYPFELKNNKIVKKFDKTKIK